MKIGLWKAKGEDRRSSARRWTVLVLAPHAGSTDAVLYTLFFALRGQFPNVKWTDLDWQTNGWSTKVFQEPLIGDLLPPQHGLKGGDK